MAFWAFARGFPRLLALTVTLLGVDALVSGFSVITIAPLADLLLERPTEEWLGITKFLQRALGSVGIELSLVSAAIVAGAAVLAMSILSVLVRWSTLRMRMVVVKRLINESCERIFDASWKFFASVRKGDLINTFVNEVNKTGNAFQSLSLAIANIVRILAFIAVPLWIEPTLVMVCVISSVLLLSPFLMLGEWSYRFGSQNVLAANRYTSLVRESLEAAKEVIGFGQKDRTIQQVNRAYDRYASTRVKSDTFSFFASQMYEPVGFLALLITLGVARANDVAVTSIAVVLWGVLRTIPPLKQTIHLKHQLDNTLPSLEQVRSQQDMALQFPQVSGGRDFSGIEQGLKLIDVTFAYDQDTPALKGITLDVPRGATVALVGESGSGKSTLTDLLIGLQRPDSGSILLDGVPLHEYDLSAWRRRIGVVPQHPVLFDLSVRENLLWAKPNASEDELWAACSAAGVDRFLRELPQGLDTAIGDTGIRLSGGQAQRLALARAIVRQPSLLLLDEATSALDSESEAAVLESVHDVGGERTTIVIAHRLSTIASADRIYAMRAGEVIEVGTFDELVVTDGYFSRLLELQRL